MLTTSDPNQETSGVRGRAPRGRRGRRQLLLGAKGVEAQELPPLRDGRRQHHWLVRKFITGKDVFVQLAQNEKK